MNIQLSMSLHLQPLAIKVSLNHSLTALIPLTSSTKVQTLKRNQRCFENSFQKRVPDLNWKTKHRRKHKMIILFHRSLIIGTFEMEKQQQQQQQHQKQQQQ